MRLKISTLSAFCRAESHLTQQTWHGALVTICGVILALYLFGHETLHFWRLHDTVKMDVDLERRHELPINFGITFPSIPCAALSISVLDAAGTHQSDISFARDMEVHKNRLDSKGAHIGLGEYRTPQSQIAMDEGAGDTRMNINLPQAIKHLEQIEEEAGRHEGCRLDARLVVHRVAGRVHLSLHQQILFQMLPQLLGAHRIPVLHNTSHIIHYFSFGPYFPGQINPLDGFDRIFEQSWRSVKYFLKVVPTQYFQRFGGATETQQYSVTEYVSPISDQHAIPAIDFIYDMSPIVVTINSKPPSILHYLVRMCAVLGGVFAVTRMVVHHLNYVVAQIAKSL